jgi:hypothetical protein
LLCCNLVASVITLLVVPTGLVAVSSPGIYAVPKISTNSTTQSNHLPITKNTDI